MSTHVEDGSMDYTGQQPEKQKTGGWKRAALVVGPELVERMTTLGVATNLVTYLTQNLRISTSRAPNIVTNFLGTSFIFCLVGGFVADTYLGRFRTIAVASTIQITGMLVLTLLTSLPSLRLPPCMSGQACPSAGSQQLSLLYLSLYLCALGTGGIKSNVSAFGADQFDQNDSKERNLMTYFFNWFFVTISIGALVSLTVLVYLQDNVSRGLGYGLCAGSMVLAVIILLAGMKGYRYKAPSGSPLSRIFRVFVAAYKKRKLEPSSLPSKDVKDVQPTRGFRFLDKAAIREDDKGVNDEWLCTLAQVEDVKMILRTLPIWATTITFYTVYAQLLTFSVVQGSLMERKFGRFVFPAASSAAFLFGTIMITVAMYDRFFVPLARRITGNPSGITTLQRIAVGLVLSCMAMGVAAIVERKRLQLAKSHNLLDKPNVPTPMSIFWILPQYILVGMGEGFTYIGQLEFFYRESPDGMRSLAVGLFLSTNALGFYLSSFLVSVVNKVSKDGRGNGWIVDNLNRSNLDNFYWLLTVVSAINILLYFVCATWYKYRTRPYVEDDKTVHV